METLKILLESNNMPLGQVSEINPPFGFKAMLIPFMDPKGFVLEKYKEVCMGMYNVTYVTSNSNSFIFITEK